MEVVASLHLSSGNGSPRSLVGHHTQAVRFPCCASGCSKCWLPVETSRKSSCCYPSASLSAGAREECGQRWFSDCVCAGNSQNTFSCQYNHKPSLNGFAGCQFSTVIYKRIWLSCSLSFSISIPLYFFSLSLTASSFS